MSLRNVDLEPLSRSEPGKQSVVPGSSVYGQEVKISVEGGDDVILFGCAEVNGRGGQMEGAID